MRMPCEEGVEERCECICVCTTSLPCAAVTLRNKECSVQRAACMRYACSTTSTAHNLQALPPPSTVTTRPPRDDQTPSAPPPSSGEKRVAGTYPAADKREATSGFVHDLLEARAS